MAKRLNSSPREASEDFGRVPLDGGRKRLILRPMRDMSYPKWCALLTANVLKTRAPFSWFLSTTISLHREPSLLGPSTPAFFPVPVLPGNHFDRMPRGCSATRRRRIHVRRTIHCICVALNFWHLEEEAFLVSSCGGSPMRSTERLLNALSSSSSRTAWLSLFP